MIRWTGWCRSPFDLWPRGSFSGGLGVGTRQRMLKRNLVDIGAWIAPVIAAAFTGSTFWILSTARSYRAEISQHAKAIRSLDQVNAVFLDLVDVVQWSEQPKANEQPGRWRRFRLAQDKAIREFSEMGYRENLPGSSLQGLPDRLVHLDRLFSDFQALTAQSGDKSMQKTILLDEIQSSSRSVRAAVGEIRNRLSDISADLGQSWGSVRFLCVTACLGMFSLAVVCSLLRRSNVKRNKAECLLDAQNSALRSLAAGEDLGIVLNHLTHSVEGRFPGMLCSILLLDSSRSRLGEGSGGSLPREHCAAIEGLQIGPEVGSCGTAAFWNKRVIVDDVMTDPLWTSFRETAARYGLRACWSEPINSRDGAVLGTFASYYKTARHPSRAEIQVIERAADLASVAIERFSDIVELRSNRDELEIRIRARTAELEGVNAALRDEMEQRRIVEEQNYRQQQEFARISRLGTLGALAAGLAHDLNQPLTAVASYSAGAMRMIRSGNTDKNELIEVLSKATVEANRAGEVLRRIRYSIQHRRHQRDPIDLNDLIRQSAGLFAREVSSKAINLRLALTDRVPSIEADSVGIQQVLLNLILNSIDSLSAPGVSKREITVSTEVVDSNTVEFSIVDTGSGVSEEAQNLLFQPFFTTKTHGLGLGLSISRAIVEEHGGRILAFQPAEPGAAFKVTLPVS